MFIELTKQEDDDQYPFLVNVERIMWVDPLVNGHCRLYMNVADDAGTPATVDVAHNYDDMKEKLNKGDKHADE